MIILRNDEKAKLKYYLQELKRFKTVSGSLLSESKMCVIDCLKRIYTDGIVAGLSVVPELKRLIDAICAKRDETVAEFVKAETSLYMEDQPLPIEYYNQLCSAYKEQQKKNFVVCDDDSILFYYYCEKLSEVLGRTPEETNASFVLKRLNKNAEFEFAGPVSPLRERVLEFCVECAKNGTNPFDALPRSYKVRLLRIVAANEKMTLREWFEKRVVPLANGKRVPMVYMLSANKEVRHAFEKRNTDPIAYSNKVNNYLKWNNLPDYFVNIFPKAQVVSKYFLEPLKKPEEFESSRNLMRLKKLSKMNPDNLFGIADQIKTNAALFDLMLFVGDGYNYDNPTEQMQLTIDKATQVVNKDKEDGLIDQEFDMVEYIRRFNNVDVINDRKDFIVKQREYVENGVEDALLELMRNKWLGRRLPANFFETYLGHYAKKIAQEKGDSCEQFLSENGFSVVEGVFLEDESVDVTKEEIDEIKATLSQKYKAGFIPHAFKNTAYGKQCAMVAKRCNKKFGTFMESIGFKCRNMLLESEVVEKLDALFPNKIITRELPITLKRAVGLQAEMFGETFDEFLIGRGYTIIKSDASDDELFALIKKLNPDGIEKSYFVFDPLGRLVKDKARGKSVNMIDFAESFGVKVEDSLGQTKDVASEDEKLQPLQKEEVFESKRYEEVDNENKKIALFFRRKATSQREK